MDLSPFPIPAQPQDSHSPDEPEKGCQVNKRVSLNATFYEGKMFHNAHQRPAFRVFISSTFADFQHERTFLEERVFPRVREYCDERSATFQSVDLRWGVTAEAARELRAVDLCQIELSRCQRLSPRPNFIALCGDRYGWCPPPRSIQTDTFDRLLTVITSENADYLRSLYIEDECSLEPQRVLLCPPAHQLDRLAIILANAAALAFPDNPAIRLPFVASITHQEIVAGALSQAVPVDHVFLFERHFVDLPARDAGSYVNCYADYSADGQLDESKLSQQTVLRRDLAARLPPASIYSVATTVRKWPNPHVLEQLGKRLEEHLCRVIDAELESRGHSATSSTVSALPPTMSNSAPNDGLVHRPELTKAIDDVIESRMRPVIFVIGESGVGKSTLMRSHHLTRIANHKRSIWASIGDERSGSELHGVLSVLCGDMAAEFGTAAGILEDTQALAVELARLTELMAGEDVTVFVDGLDQLHDTERAHELWWLPESFPSGPVFVLSAVLSGGATPLATAVESRRSIAHTVTVHGLGTEKALRAVELALARMGRKMLPRQQIEVRRSLQSDDSPLHAALVARILQPLHSLSPTLDIPGDTGLLTGRLCDLLAQTSNHGPVMIGFILSVLSHSRTGLEEQEILDLLTEFEPIRVDLKQRYPHSPLPGRIPFAVWSRLRSDLSPFLAENLEGQQLRLFHSRIRRGIDVWSTQSGLESRQTHSILARYLIRRGLHERRLASDSIGIRYLSEAVHHACAAQDSRAIAELLSAKGKRRMLRLLGTGASLVAIRRLCHAAEHVTPFPQKLVQSAIRAYRFVKENARSHATSQLGIADLVLSGNSDAAIALANSLPPRTHALVFFALAELFRAIGRPKLAGECQDRAGDIRHADHSLTPLESELIESLVSPHPAPEIAPLQATRPSDDDSHSRPSRLVEAAGVICGSFVTCGVAYALGTTASNAQYLVVYILSNNPDAFFGCFFSLLFLYAVPLGIRKGTRPIVRSAILSLLQRCSQTDPYARYHAVIACRLLDISHRDWSGPHVLYNAPSAIQLLSRASESADPTLFARFLIHCDYLGLTPPSALRDMFGQLPTQKQIEVIDEVEQFLGAVSKTTFLAVAIGCAPRFSNTASVVSRLYQLSTKCNGTRGVPSTVWSSDGLSAEQRRSVLASIPRLVRVEMIIDAQRNREPSYIPHIVRGAARIARTMWHTMRGTLWCEQLLIASSVACFAAPCVWVVAVEVNGGLWSLAVRFVIAFAVVLAISALWEKMTAFNARNRRFRLDSRRRPENIWLLSCHVPWNWSHRLPLLFGWMYLNLFGPRIGNMQSLRQDYGRSLELDLDVYQRQWETLYRIYNGVVRSAMIPPALAFIGPAGIAELLAIRLVLNRGWGHAARTVTIPPASWSRVVHLLTSEMCLGVQKGMVSDLLEVPVACDAALRASASGVASTRCADWEFSDEAWNRRLADEYRRVQDIEPQWVHRTIVSFTAVAIAAVSGVLVAAVDKNPEVSPSEFCVVFGFAMTFLPVCVYLPSSNSNILRIVSALSGFVMFVAGVLLVGGDYSGDPIPRTPAKRGWFFAAVNSAVLPILFFAPWVVACFRSSLVVFPSRGRRIVNQCLAIVLFFASVIAVAWHQAMSVGAWRAAEELFNLSWSWYFRKS